MKYNPKFLQIGAGWIVANVEAILIMCTPLLSPLPAMFAAMRALTLAGWQYAALIGVIVELMGLATGAFMGVIESHNYRNPESRISPRWGYALFAFYILVIETLILSGDPNAVSILLPGLTVIGSIMVGFRTLMRRAEEQRSEVEAQRQAVAETNQRRQDKDHDLDMNIKRQEAAQRLELQRLEAAQRLEIERQKADMKLSTMRKTVDKVDSRNSQSKQSTTSEQAVDSADIVNKLLQVYTDNPKTSLRKAAGIVGLSHTGVDKMLGRLAAEGRIARNGKVEVLP